MKKRKNSIEILAKKKDKIVMLNSQINTILPELMNRNMKLIKRLKNKLVVSTLCNNVEERNKEFFNGFIYSSDKRLKDLKTGSKMTKAINDCEEKMSPITAKMQKDIILSHENIFLKQKKLIKEKTEEETHIKIHKLINKLRTSVKTDSKYEFNPIKKKKNMLSSSEIKKASNYIGEKIKQEESQVNETIKDYLKNMHEILDEDSETNNIYGKEYYSPKNYKIKAFSRYVNTLRLQKDIDLMNYTKPKPKTIKDKEAANLLKLQKYIITSKEFEKKMNQSNSNNRIQNLFSRNNTKVISLTKNKSMNDLEDLNQISTNGKDTIQILGKLRRKDNFLRVIMDKKIKKINSLVDMELPYPFSYDIVMNRYRIDKKRNKTNENNKNYNSWNTFLKDKSQEKLSNILTIDVSKSNISLLKEHIKNINYKNLL